MPDILGGRVEEKKKKTVSASSGNRTRAARVAGEHSTTEPTMLHDWLVHNRVLLLSL
jgi:hypothetical protein